MLVSIKIACSLPTASSSTGFSKKNENLFFRHLRSALPKERNLALGSFSSWCRGHRVPSRLARSKAIPHVSYQAPCTPEQLRLCIGRPPLLRTSHSRAIRLSQASYRGCVLFNVR